MRKHSIKTTFGDHEITLPNGALSKRQRIILLAVMGRGFIRTRGRFKVEGTYYTYRADDLRQFIEISFANKHLIGHFGGLQRWGFYWKPTHPNGFKDDVPKSGWQIKADQRKRTRDRTPEKSKQLAIIFKLRALKEKDKQKAAQWWAKHYRMMEGAK
jgi:hypothetical protein